MKWKKAERKIAKLVGGQRNPVAAQIISGVPDVSSGRLAIEVKDWDPDRFPRWLINAFGQAETVARPGQIPVLVLHPHGARYVESYAVIRLKTLLDLVFGNDSGD